MTRKNIPAAESTAPTVSNLLLLSAGSGSAIPRQRTTTSPTIAACSRKVARQLIVVVIRPPISGPAAAPIPAMPLITPNARARDCTSSKSSVARM
jgi:hypothetical protein